MKNRAPMKTLTHTFAIAATLGAMTLNSVVAFAQPMPATDGEPTYTTSDNLKVIPYRAFGPLFYEKNLKFPVAAPWFAYNRLAAHRILLKPSVQANAGADETGWVPVPVGDGKVYYRAEYHLGDLLDVSMDQYMADAIRDYNGRLRGGWQLSADQQRDFKTKSKMQVVVYPTDQFRAQFFPGTTILTHEIGSMTKGALGSVRGGIKMKASYSKVTKEMGAVAGVFKGTFDNVDCIREGRLPGLIVDGQTIDAPLANLATIATYEDGTTRISTWAKLPRQGIQMLRQNEFPVLDGGQLNPAGAMPTRWNRFEDSIMRSYMFMSADGKYIGYVWTNFTHPSFIAKVMQKLNFSDLMLMDIHPAFGAGVRQPMVSGQATPDFFGKGGSYPLVPMESDVISWGASAAAAVARGGKRIQWNYKSAQGGSPNDFIAVFAK